MGKAIRRVAVLGSGVMGSGIAAHMANAGFEVLLLDIAPKDPKAPRNGTTAICASVVASYRRNVAGLTPEATTANILPSAEAAAPCGIVSVVAALTLLPAVLSLLGDRVNALRIPWVGRRAIAMPSGFWWPRSGRGSPRSIFC